MATDAASAGTAPSVEEWEVVDTALVSLGGEWVELDQGGSADTGAASPAGKGGSGWLAVDPPAIAELRRAYSDGGAAALPAAAEAAAEQEPAADAKASPEPGAATEEEGAAFIEAMTGYDTAAAISLATTAPASVVNAKDSSSWTALHWAAFRGHTEACKVLLERPDFKVANARARWLWGGGYTALHLAAAKGHTEVCQSILASPRFTEAHLKRGGRSAVDLARQFKHEPTAKALSALLVAHGTAATPAPGGEKK